MSTEGELGSELKPGEKAFYPKAGGGTGMWVYREENGERKMSNEEPDHGILASGGQNARGKPVLNNAAIARIKALEKKYGANAASMYEREEQTKRANERYEREKAEDKAKALEAREKELAALEAEVEEITVGGVIKDMIVPQDALDWGLLAAGPIVKGLGKAKGAFKIVNKAKTLEKIRKERAALKAEIEALKKGRKAEEEAAAAKRGEKGTNVEQKGDNKPDKKCQNCPNGGKPVNPIYGTKVLSGEIDLDFMCNGPLAFGWQRTYVSSNAHVGWLGQGWTVPIAFRLDILDDAIIYVDLQGRRTPFPILAVGEQSFSPYDQVTLKRIAWNEYELKSVTGMRLLFGLTGPQSTAALKDDKPPEGDDRPPQADSLMLCALIDSNENIVRIIWRADGLPAYLIDSTGRRIGFYFEKNRLIQILEMHGEPSRNGRYTQNQLELIVQYEYDGNGDLVKVIDSTYSIVRTFVYKNHIMVEHAEPKGTVSRYEWDQYDANGRVLRNTVNTGEHWIFQYDDRAGQTIVTDGTGRRTIYHFDDEKNFLGVTDLSGHTTRRLDLYGHLIAMVNPAGHKTVYRYDDQCNLISIEEPDGAVTTVAYHSDLHKPTAITNALGQTSRFAYDTRGNLIEHVAADGAVTQYRLNARGLPVEIINPKSGVVTFAYDDAWRLISYADCSGNVTRYEYDTRGNLISITNPNGARTEFTYARINRRDRVVHIKTPDGGEERRAYDTLGRLIAHHDALAQVTQYTLDIAGRPITTRNPLGHTLHYAYDIHGRLTTIYDEQNATMRFAYNDLDQLVSEQGFDGKRLDYRYDSAGHLSECIDNPNSVQPIRTRYRRDVMGRLLAKISLKSQNSSGAEAPCLVSTRNRYRYDKLGQLIFARNRAAQMEFGYNTAGQLIREITKTRAGFSGMLEHQYDLLGNRTKTILPDGRHLNTLHYGSGHVHQINLDGVVICDFERDKLHREVVRTQGGLVSHFQRDGSGRLLASYITPSDSRSDMSTVPASGQFIARQYEYDRGGQLLQLVDRRESTTRYRYDPIGRLLAAQQDTLLESFSYDSAHNLLDGDAVANTRQKPVKTSFSQEEWAALVKANIDNPKFNPLQVLDEFNHPDKWKDGKINQIRVYQDKRYSYDDFGNTVEKKIGAHTVQQYRWNAEHQLDRATVSRQGITQTFEYEYDPFGRRISKYDQFGVTYFMWDGGQLLSEQRGHLHRLYVYQPGCVIPLAQLNLDQLSNEPIEVAEIVPPIPVEWMALYGQYPKAWKKAMAMEKITPAQLAEREIQALQPNEQKRKKPTIYYYHNDHLGTPRELTDCDGDIRWSATYAAWGNTLKVVVVEKQSDPMPVEQALRFQGQYFDTETGLHYNRFRYFDPDTGRFISQDPIGVAGGTNPYQYAPNPTRYVDPTGLSKHVDNLSKVVGPIDTSKYRVHHIFPQHLTATIKKFCPNYDQDNVENLIALPKHEDDLPSAQAQRATSLTKAKYYGTTVHAGGHALYNEALASAGVLAVKNSSNPCKALGLVQAALRASLITGTPIHENRGASTMDWKKIIEDTAL